MPIDKQNQEKQQEVFKKGLNKVLMSTWEDLYDLKSEGEEASWLTHCLTSH